MPAAGQTAARAMTIAMLILGLEPQMTQVRNTRTTRKLCYAYSRCEEVPGVLRSAIAIPEIFSAAKKKVKIM